LKRPSNSEPYNILGTILALSARMKYRSRIEIMDSVLRSIRSGATKTHIMYRAYMSYAQLKEYLALLQERNLIAFDSQSQLFTLTEKGLKFLNTYETIEELVPNVVDRNVENKQAVTVDSFSY